MAISPTPMDPTGNEQRSEPESLLRGLGRAKRCVCAIEGAGAKAGTGILIAPDLVLTNYHVVERLLIEGSSLEGAECRFDFRNDADGRLLRANGTQTIFKIKQVKIAQSSPSPGDSRDGGDRFNDDELDYAIVRLEMPAGLLNDAEGKTRGWITLPWPKELPDPDIGMEICILQHPYQEGGLHALQPLKSDYAEFVGTRGDRARGEQGAPARYVHNGATRLGSSGGPCFSTAYEFAFIALHNASLGTKGGQKDLGQAIPLSRIAKHIKKYVEQADRILGREPPVEAETDAHERQRADSIERRKTAALCLMDRSSEENEFLAKLFASASEQQTSRPLLHVVVCRKDDAHDRFMERLVHLSFEIKPDNVGKSKLEALTKGLSAPTRAVQLTAWPQLKEIERRRKDLSNYIGLLDARGRYLLLLSKTIDDAWSPSTEEPLLREFATMLATRFEGNREGIQAVVFFIVSKGQRTDVLASGFADLWRDGVPPYCGVCVELSRVGVDDLDEWRSYLENAWNENPAFAEAIRRQFDGAGLKPLDEVAKGLDESLSKYIADTLDRIGLRRE